MGFFSLRGFPMLKQGPLSNVDVVVLTLDAMKRPLRASELTFHARQLGLIDRIDYREADSVHKGKINFGAIVNRRALPESPVDLLDGVYFLTNHAEHYMVSLKGMGATASEPADVLSVVHNSDRGIELGIKSAVPFLQCREIIVNGLEAPRSIKGKLTVRITSLVINGVRKLAIVNDALGMSNDDLMRLLSFNNTTKKFGLRDNHGEGAKISLAKYNPEGIQWFTRVGDGPIRSVFFKKGSNKKWGPEIQHADGATRDEKCISEIDAAPFGDLFPSTGDFTAVVLYGMRPNHDTTVNPYDFPTTPEPRAVAFEIFNRFYSFNDIAGYPVDVQIDRNLISSETTSYRHIVPQGELHRRYPDRFRITRVKLSSGVEIEYVKSLEEGDSRRTAYTQHSVGPNASRCALVYRNELYDVSAADEWRAVAPSFGLGPVATNIGVFIHIPDAFGEIEGDEDSGIVPGRYRDYIELNGTEQRCMLWKDDVINLRPDWILEEINGLLGNGDASRLKEELLAYAAKLTAEKSSVGDSWIRKTKSGGSTGGAGGGGGGTRTSPPKRMGVIPRDKSDNTVAPIVPPNIHWVTPNLIQSVEGRIGYYAHETNDLYLNQKHKFYIDAYNFAGGMLASAVTAQRTSDLSTMVETATKDRYALVLAKHVMFATANNGSAIWPNQEREAALGTEVLMGVAKAAVTIDQIIDSVKANPLYQEIARTTGARRRRPMAAA